MRFDSCKFVTLSWAKPSDDTNQRANCSSFNTSLHWSKPAEIVKTFNDHVVIMSSLSSYKSLCIHSSINRPIP